MDIKVNGKFFKKIGKVVRNEVFHFSSLVASKQLVLKKSDGYGGISVSKCKNLNRG